MKASQVMTNRRWVQQSHSNWDDQDRRRKLLDGTFRCSWSAISPRRSASGRCRCEQGHRTHPGLPGGLAAFLASKFPSGQHYPEPREGAATLWKQWGNYTNQSGDSKKARWRRKGSKEVKEGKFSLSGFQSTVPGISIDSLVTLSKERLHKNVSFPCSL